jgi:hypothetical protein
LLERERERERNRERHRERDKEKRERERQKHTHTNRERERERERDRERERERERRESEKNRDRDRERDRERERATYLEIRAMLVQCIVGKMHACIIDVLFCGLYIFFCAHTDKTIVEQVHSQRLNRTDQTINTQIKFKSI